MNSKLEDMFHEFDMNTSVLGVDDYTIREIYFTAGFDARNAEVRELKDTFAGFHNFKKLEALEAENLKLKELVKEAYPLMEGYSSRYFNSAKFWLEKAKELVDV